MSQRSWLYSSQESRWDPCRSSARRLWDVLWHGDIDVRRRLIISHIIGAGAVVLAVTSSRPIQRLLEHRGVRQFGRLSFSLYLVHGLVLFLIGNAVFIGARRAGMYYSLSSIVATTVVVAISTCVARVFTAWVDQPAIELSRRVGERFSRRLGARTATLSAPDNLPQ